MANERGVPGLTLPITDLTETDIFEDSIQKVAKDLVVEKYELTNIFANYYSGLAERFMREVKDSILLMTDFEPTIDVENLDIRIDQDWQSLITSIPTSPLTADDYNILLPSGLEWNFHEEAYVSSLLNSLRTELLDIIENGHTGLGASVEQAMWDRESERDALALQEAKEKIADNWTARGFSLPSVGLFSSMNQVDVEYLNKRLDKSRAIAEETRKLALQMLQKSIEESVKLEGVTQDYSIKYNTIRLEAAKATIDYGLRIIDVAIKKLEAKVKAYEMEVRAYVARVDAIKSVIDAQIAVIDGKVKYITAKIQAAIAELDAKIKLLGMKYGITQDAATKMAQIAAQITASALAAFNASANVSGNFSVGLSQSQSANISEQYQKNEDVTTT